MKKKEVKNLLPFNLQFFADGGDDPGNEPDNNDNDDNGGSDDDSKDSSKEKKFTQEEVTRLMTREKKEGRKAAIKSLGFESEELIYTFNFTEDDVTEVAGKMDDFDGSFILT